MKVIKTGISPQYVSEWTVGMAVREVLQNYLDSLHEFECGGSIVLDKGVAKIKDNGPGLEARHLAMGISEKSEERIGKFGEGLKLAVLVLAREDRSPEIWSNGKIMQAKIHYDEDYGTDLLQFECRDMKPRHAARFHGTSIKFLCDERELQEGKAFFQEFQQTKWLVKDKISATKGIIWLNGSAIAHLKNALFGYHLNAVKIGNRDRSTVSDEELLPHIQNIYGDLSSRKVCETLLKCIKTSNMCWEIESTGVTGSYPNSHTKKLWKAAFTRVFGKQAILPSNDNTLNVQAEYRGFYLIRDIPYGWAFFLRRIGIKSVEDIQDNKPARLHTYKRSELSPTEKKSIDTAKALAERYYHPTGKLKIVANLDLVRGERQTTLGMYDPSADTIYIKKDILENIRKTVHTVLHEAVHKHSKANDCTHEFEVALLDVSVGMMEKGGWK